MNKGSTWNKWDFHVHTPFSVLNNQFGNPYDEKTWEHYVDLLEEKSEELNIKAIGITDYFVIDGYKKLLEYKKIGRLQQVLIFPNIEFRIGIYIDNKRINYHVILSPELDAEVIEDHFLNDLTFVHDTSPFTASENHKLKRSKLEEFGEAHRVDHPSFQQLSSFEVGCMLAKVDHQQIKETLENESRFKGNYLLIADGTHSDLDWGGQAHATRKEILQMSHAIFSSNNNDRDFLLGKLETTKEEIIAAFKTLKPCIWGCDSHGYSQRFLEPDQNRFCWIKSIVSWEGLKQILYEPESRVRIQENSPEPPKSIYTIDKLQIHETKINDALKIDNFQLDVNHNLITLIGGRGSGKTALLDLIASCFPEGTKLTKLKNSFYYRIYENRNDYSKNPMEIPISLRFRSDKEFSKKIGSTSENDYVKITDILYLTQNHMEDYTVNPTKLYGHIIELLFNRIPEKLQWFRGLEKEVEAKINQIQSLSLEIEQTKNFIENNLNREIKKLEQRNGERNDYQDRLNERLASQDENQSETLDITNTLDNLKNEKIKAIFLSEQIKEIKERAKEFIDFFEGKVSIANQLITENQEKPKLELFPRDLSRLNNIIQKTTSDIEKLSLFINECDEQIEVLDNNLNELKGSELIIADLRRQINDLSTEISQIETSIGDIRKQQENVELLTNKRINCFADLSILTIKQKEFLQSIINQFEIDQNELLTDLSFLAKIDFGSTNEYIQDIAYNLDGRSHSYKSIEDDLLKIIKDFKAFFDSSNCDREELLGIIEKLDAWGKSTITKKQITESALFNSLFFPFFSIGLHISFNKRPIESLSMGERAIVLLKILLGLDDTPLLIDQPEEHLDNRYIYDELVPAFRNAKNKRQIILATHNANLVVNTDAEQIIIANNKNDTLSYTSGALEEGEICESIKEILEGGDEAFKKREEKYGFVF